MTDKELYVAICRQSPASMPVFWQCWWLDAVSDDWDTVVTLKGDQITGVWPYMPEDRLSISFRRNPRLTPYLGPHVFFPPDIKESNRDSHEHEVVDQLLTQLPYADVWRLSLYPGLKQAGLFRKYGLNMGVQQTFLVSLREDEEAIYQQFKEPLRRNIRAAEKEVAITNEPDLLPELAAFQKETLFNKRVEVPHTPEQMARLMQACLEHKAGALWVARIEGEVQAIVWNVWDAHTSYYFMGAKNPKVENYRAMSALLWHCIREARTRGNHTFDLEGSMDPGVERFFRNFGGRRELYLVLRKDGHWFWKLVRLLRRN